MDNYKVYLTKDGTTYDITSVTGDFSWKDSVDTLGMEFSCEVIRNVDDRFMANYNLAKVGDKITLSNNGEEVFRGVVVDLDTSRYAKSIKALDYAFYLNKSKTTTQINETRVDAAIKQLCQKFGIPLGNLTDIPTVATKIYKDATISDIIKDLLDMASAEYGTRYRMEVRRGLLHVEKYYDLVVEGKYKPATNLGAFSIANTIGGDISMQESIEDMRNKVIITSGDEKSVQVIAGVEDKDSISKYGLLQHAESVDEKNIAQAANIAKNRLKEMNRVEQKISVTLLGDDKVRSARSIELNFPKFGLSGKYFILDCSHSYKKGIHTMSLSIEKVI